MDFRPFAPAPPRWGVYLAGPGLADDGWTLLYGARHGVGAVPFVFPTEHEAREVACVLQPSHPCHLVAARPYDPLPD